MTDVNTAIDSSLGKITHKFLSWQEKVKFKKTEKSLSVSIQKQTPTAEKKQNGE